MKICCSNTRFVHGEVWMGPLDTLGLVHMGSQLPSPTHVSESQYGDKVPTFEPLKIIEIRLTFNNVRSWLCHAKIFGGIVLRIEFSFLLDPTLKRSHNPHLHKMLPYGHICHTWDLRLGMPCEVGTWDAMWNSKPQLPCFQRLRLHRSNSRNLGLRTPCEPALGLNCYAFKLI